MRRLRIGIVLSAVLVAMVAAGAFAGSLTVPKGTPVHLVFDQALNSKTAREGTVVKLHVKADVVVKGKTVVKKSTAVTAVVAKVDQRGRYGKNARLRLAVNPVPSVYGKALPVEARSKGQVIGGEKSDKAAAATAGGAVVLGPVGLAGGYFIHGKPVNIKVGDTLQTEVSKDITLTWRNR